MTRSRLDLVLEPVEHLIDLTHPVAAQGLVEPQRVDIGADQVVFWQRLERTGVGRGSSRPPIRPRNKAAASPATTTTRAMMNTITTTGYAT